MLILGPGRRIAFANPGAERVLASGRVLKQVGGALRGATDPVERLLRRITADKPGSGPASIEEVVTMAPDPWVRICRISVRMHR